MRRPWLVLLVVLVALAAATGCSSSGSTAATVGGVDISRASLEADLRAIDSSDAYRAALEESYGAPLAGEAKGTFNTTFAAQVLTLRIYYEMIEKGLEKGGEKVTADDLDEAEAAVNEQFAAADGGQEILDGFPKAYRERLIRQQALVIPSRRMVIGEGGDPEALFQADPSRFIKTCVSHILVGLTDRDDAAAKAKAEELKRRLDRGESFATIANEESDDSGADGDLGCHIPGNFDADFEAAMASATIGTPTAPVKTRFGYHLVLVRERRNSTFVDVREEVEAVVQRESGEALDAFLVGLTCDEKTVVTVDPRYGTWDLADCDGSGSGSGLGKVVPPAGPQGTTTTTAG